jgi:peptidoglycan/xylan/chitin deacetylase (PgdA/CDA1 family)
MFDGSVESLATAAPDAGQEEAARGMKARRKARKKKVAPYLVLAGTICAVMIAAGTVVGVHERSSPATGIPTVLEARAVSLPGPVRPLDNDASAGKIVFTFDDGPGVYTQALLKELKALHLRAVFFVFGYKAQAYPQVIREELADGDVVENHTWDHPSFTGASTDTPPLPAAKIKAELQATQQAIVAAGAPEPTLYRPPFGDITAADNQIAAGLGLRVVEPFSVTATGTPIDSRDWTGIPAAQIVRDVTLGYDVGSRYVPGIHAGSVIGFHDSAPGTQCSPGETQLCNDVVNTIRSLPDIVAYMNRHHLGVTTDVPANTSGGVVPNIPVK